MNTMFLMQIIYNMSIAISSGINSEYQKALYLKGFFNALTQI